ncbi:protein eyes shut isoform X1 [Temnothorax curvispinosus]|uniref:Protein eyes shut isoform X1 n=2 Tax=Temnothorax curvispinosus TaxID=300111 RepID=A0A6J1QJH6_9HYME|nr:protein eyes shut isoform X1 [Temnothorax curvispinosus]
MPTAYHNCVQRLSKVPCSSTSRILPFFSVAHRRTEMGRYVRLLRLAYKWSYYPSSSRTACKNIFTLIVLSTMITVFALGSDCSGDPCMYGICLDNENSTYSCYCIDGYTGINCEINWDECWSDPCLNGGTCNDGVAAYNCTCLDGFVGVNCEQRYSECSNHPCLNNGTCVDYDGITCQCLDGYSGATRVMINAAKKFLYRYFLVLFPGEYCEIDASVCNETMCKNSGECIEGPGFSFYCRCREGWTGILCEEDVDECLELPCRNGGLCINIPSSYTCACLFGFTGKDCDKAIVPCKDNPCQNGAVCLLEDDRPVCYCVPDYHGALCELRYDDCESKFAQCDNGGTCIDGINSFTCSCPPNYGGPMCEYSFLSTTTLEVEDTSEQGTSIVRATTAVVSPKESTSIVDMSLPLSSTSTISFAVYSTTPKSSPYTKRYTIMEKTTTPRYEGESSSVSGDSSVFLTEVPSTSPTRDDFVTSKPVTVSSAVTEGYLYETETESIEVYLPTGRSIHDGEVTKAPDYDQTTKIHPPFSSRVDEDVTEYTTSYRPTMDMGEGQKDDRTNVTSAIMDHATDVTLSIDTTFRYMTDSIQNRTFDFGTTIMDMPRTVLPLTTSSTLPSVLSSTMRFDTSTVPSPLTSTSGSSLSQTTVTGIEMNTTEIGACRGNQCSTSTTALTPRNVTEYADGCKTDSTITQAAFNGKSFVRQRVEVIITENKSATLRIYLKLRTAFKNGIILHVYFDNERYSLVYLELGSLKFQFSCGLETMLLGEIDAIIDNGYEVGIDMSFQYVANDENEKCFAKLLVNGTMAVTGEQILPQRGMVPKYANLYIGGIPLTFSHYFPHVAMGFIGCMDSLKVNDITRHFIHDSLETFQIEECTSFLCLSNPCQNFGACEESEGRIRCKCIAGYTGPLCEHSACNDNPCSMGATCVSSPGTGFICVCPLGSHGLFCEEDAILVRPAFSVLVPGFASYIAYGVTTSIKDTMELKLRLIPRTFDQISLIAYLGQRSSRRDVSDHLSITFVRGYIMLTWDLGSGVRRIFTSDSLTSLSVAGSAGKSKTYTLRIGRRGKEAWLAVEGLKNVTGQAVGSMTQLDVSPILYIGGYKSKNFDTLPHDLPLHTGFSGCIFDVELRTDTTILPLTGSSPATGRGVGECNRNECIRHSCKNGAVCLHHGASYSCICTKEWVGPDCSIPI